jgi:hypothetical protein
VQVVLITLMTLIAGLSAHAGLKWGVRVMATISFVLLTMLMFATLLADDTSYLLNLLVQSLGHHLHDLLDLSFQTDAFEQLNMDIDGKSGPKVWMDWWTVFYWGWWVSWSPFVGIFIARISKGRTIGQVINASITGPVVWTFLWFGVFGGAGLRYERAAILDGCLGHCQTVASGVPFDAKYCRSSSSSSVSSKRTWQGQADFELQEKARLDLFQARRPRGCESITQLSMAPLDLMWFKVLSQYNNIGTMLVIMSVVAMVLSVVTTNDSGSIVLNMIASNGMMKGGSYHGNRVQKQLWSFIIGLISIVMLLAGESKALIGLQTCIIALGLPNTFQTCMVCYSVKLAMDMELHKDTNVNKTVSEGRYNKLTGRDNGMEFWGSSILRPFRFVDYLLTISRKHPPPTQPPSLVEAGVLWPTMALFPFYWVGVCSLMCEQGVTDASLKIKLLQWDPRNKALLRAQALAAATFVSFSCFFSLCIASARAENLWVLALTSYTIFACMVGLVRHEVAVAYNLSNDFGRYV